MSIPHRKVALVGDGMVGTGYAFALANQGIAEELVLIEIPALKKKSEADALDLSHALPYTFPKRIYSGDYSDCADADLVVISAGVPQKDPSETRLELVDRNLKINKSIVEGVVASGFNGIFLVIANPVDVLTYATWKFSGFPKEKVIGTGTSLDTARLRYEIAAKADVDPRSVEAYIFAEHGDSSFPVWSHATIGGTNAKEYLLDTVGLSSTDLDEMYQNVMRAAYNIIGGKGYTNYGIASAAAAITKSILNDEKRVFGVSVFQEGQYGMSDFFTGQTAVLGANGIERRIDYKLDDDEMAKFVKSGEELKAVIDDAFAKID